MTHDNSALWELVEKLPRWDLEWEWMAECDDGDYIKRADVLAILERPVVVGDEMLSNEHLHGFLAPDHSELAEDGSGYFFTNEGLESFVLAVLTIVRYRLSNSNESMVRGKS